MVATEKPEKECECERAERITDHAMGGEERRWGEGERVGRS